MTRGALALAFAFCSAALPSATARADGSLESLHAEATDLALGGDCAAALDGYRALERAGVDDPDVAYDRALCHAELGELGRAIVWLERARALSPRDTEIVTALARAEASLGERRASEHHGEPLTEPESLFGALSSGLGTHALALLTLVFHAITFASLGAILRTRRERLRVALGLVCSFSFVLSLAMFFGVGHRLEWFDEGRLAVVVSPEATLRAGPDDRAPGRRIVREGDRVRVLDVRRGYAEVRLPDDQRGYLSSSQLEVVRRDGTD